MWNIGIESNNYDMVDILRFTEGLLSYQLLMWILNYVVSLLYLFIVYQISYVQDHFNQGFLVGASSTNCSITKIRDESLNAYFAFVLG